MKLFKKIKFNKIKKSFKRIPKILAVHSFMTILVLFLFSLALGGLIYYEYFILVKTIEPQIVKRPIQFEEETFQKILNEWQEREKRFEETDSKEYLDLFK